MLFLADIEQTVCTEALCKNFGTCVESHGETFTCDCSMSAHAGRDCLEREDCIKQAFFYYSCNTDTLQYQ